MEPTSEPVRRRGLRGRAPARLRLATGAVRRGVQARLALGRSETGLTLVEVIISVLIVALMAAAIGSTLISSTYTSNFQRKRSQAAEIAQQDQARLDGMTAGQLANLTQTRSVTADGTPFTVTSTAQFYSTSGSSSCSSSGSGSTAYYKIESSVTWPANTTTPVVIRSLLTPAAGGTMLVQVDDQTGAGLSGASVSASGADSASGTTQTGGCAVFANLTSGSFNVAVTDTGYVDQNGNSSPPSLTSTVTSTGVSTTSTSPVYMGLAGMVNADFYTPTTSPGSQKADGISYYGAGSSISMSSTKNSALSPAGTLGTLVPASGTISLFPFYFASSSNYTNNYRVWPGICQQMEPSSGYDQFTVTPGMSGTVQLEEPELDVFVKNSSGVRVLPTDVKLSFASTSGCTDSWYPTIAANAATASSGALAFPGQPFASTATSGSTASASGQTGSYTICADLQSGSSYYKTSVSSVQNNNFTAPTSTTITLPSTTSFSKC